MVQKRFVASWRRKYRERMAGEFGHSCPRHQQDKKHKQLRRQGALKKYNLCVEAIRVDTYWSGWLREQQKDLGDHLFTAMGGTNECWSGEGNLKVCVRATRRWERPSGRNSRVCVRIYDGLVCGPSPNLIIVRQELIWSTTTAGSRDDWRGWFLVQLFL